MVRIIRWPLPIQKQLANIYEYIFKDSFQNAEKVKSEILFSTKRLSESPENILPTNTRKITLDNLAHTSCIIIEYLIM